MASKELLDVKDSTRVPSLLVINKRREGQHSGATTFRPLPSSALQRAKAFLPQLASANADLEEKLKLEAKENFDIEHIDGSEDKVIEMNVALYENNSSSDSEDPTSYDQDSDDSSNEEAIFSEVSESNFRTAPKWKTQPGILVLDNVIPQSSPVKTDKPVKD